MISYWTTISRSTSESVVLMFYKRYLLNILQINRILHQQNKFFTRSFHQELARRDVVKASTSKQGCSFGVKVAYVRSFSKWRPSKYDKFVLEDDKETFRKREGGTTWKETLQLKRRTPVHKRTRLLDEAILSQGKLHKPQVHGIEQQHHLDDKIKRDAQQYQDFVSSQSYESGYSDTDSDPDSEEEQDDGRDTNIYNNSNVPRTYKNKARSKTYHESKQKTGSRGPRPSRYYFSEVSSEGERWLRRPDSHARPKGKVEWYARQMLLLTNNNEIHRALEMFDRMKDDRIRPTVEVFNILISALGKMQKIRKAFKLYNDMKKYGLKPTSHTYSSLFNACAESPSPEHALDRAEKLWSEMSSKASTKKLEMNIITCNAAMKAFAICGSPTTSFDIYDMILEQGIMPDVHTYAMLLTACGFDADQGASKAIHLLEEMRAHGVTPDIYIFNHVLKAIRDSVALKKRKQKESRLLAKDHDMNEATRFSSEQSITSTDLNKERSSLENIYQNTEFVSKIKKERVNEQKNNIKVKTDNKTGTNSNVVEQESNKFPGAENFLQCMAMEEVTPDIRTFHLLLQLAKTVDLEEEEYLLRMLKTFGIVPDEVFLNTLIRRRAVNYKLSHAKELLKMMQKEYPGLKASIRTYQSLAAGCKRSEDGLQLLNEMKEQGLSPNAEFYSTLIRNAAGPHIYRYLTELLKYMSKESIKPDQRMLTLLDKAAAVKVTQPKNELPLAARKRLECIYREQQGFRGYYKLWLRKWVPSSSKKENDEHGSEIEFASVEDGTLDYSHL